MHDPAVACLALLRATATARSLREDTVVVKLGGSAMEDSAATRGSLTAVVALQTLGLRVILVHGGGKPIDRAMEEAGLTPRKVLGRRYTDDATLDIVVRVLRKDINPGLVSQIQHLGGKAVGLHGDNLQVLFGEPLTLTNDQGEPVDLGRVGRPTDVDGDLLQEYLDSGVIPVIPSLAVDSEGRWLNVNADTAASAIAGEMSARYIAFLTDTPGVLRNRAEPSSLISTLKEEDARTLIAEGVIQGGMVPKVEACFEALAAGARSAQILDGRNPYALLERFVSDSASGTVILSRIDNP
jgi:acetylglutamate kinase